MFVISVKSKKLKSYSLIALVAVFVTLGALYYVSLENNIPVSNIGGIVMKAETAEERISFFSQFGYKINAEPCEVKEVVIPTEFDDVYTKYNELQKEQKLDLEKYKGARVKLWSYEVENYPGYENSKGVIRGNIFVFNGVIIACDISSTELDGFMKPLIEN